MDDSDCTHAVSSGSALADCGELFCQLSCREQGHQLLQGVLYYTGMLLGHLECPWDVDVSSDDTCARDFSNGYDISMVTCGIFFVFVGVTMPFGFCARACGWLETKKEGYEPVG